MIGKVPSAPSAPAAQKILRSRAMAVVASSINKSPSYKKNLTDILGKISKEPNNPERKRVHALFTSDKGEGGNKTSLYTKVINGNMDDTHKENRTGALLKLATAIGGGSPDQRKGIITALEGVNKKGKDSINAMLGHIHELEEGLDQGTLAAVIAQYGEGKMPPTVNPFIVTTPVTTPVPETGDGTGDGTETGTHTSNKNWGWQKKVGIGVAAVTALTVAAAAAYWATKRK